LVVGLVELCNVLFLFLPQINKDMSVYVVETGSLAMAGKKC